MRICWHRHLHSLWLETKSRLRYRSKRLSSRSTCVRVRTRWELSVHHLLLLLLSKEQLLLLQMILIHDILVLHHPLLFLTRNKRSLFLNLFILLFRLFDSRCCFYGSHRFKIFDTKCSFRRLQSDIVHVKFSHGSINYVFKQDMGLTRIFLNFNVNDISESFENLKAKNE